MDLADLSCDLPLHGKLNHVLGALNKRFLCQYLKHIGYVIRHVLFNCLVFLLQPVDSLLLFDVFVQDGDIAFYMFVIVFDICDTALHFAALFINGGFNILLKRYVFFHHLARCAQNKVLGGFDCCCVLRDLFADLIEVFINVFLNHASLGVFREIIIADRNKIQQQIVRNLELTGKGLRHSVHHFFVRCAVNI